ncbi:MAG: Re/Si-specific NAD(P)(+) transhydrogenase subunit alpha [Gemmatimonadaceae bacterium]
MLRVGITKETAPGERRVALTPDSVARLVKGGIGFDVERGAGVDAGYPDSAYEQAGASILPDAQSVFQTASLVARVRRPSLDEAMSLKAGTVLVALLQPASSADLLARLKERGITALSLELVPRITRAQSMDVLSSQSTVAGYKAVLLGAAMLGKLLPMLTTAAGTIAPARAFVIGAGVAGLQAIATARRLGAVVSGFDVRAAAREQVQSLGATFLSAEIATPDAEDRGGYAKAQSDEQHRMTLEAIASHIRDQDLVVTTALIPGKPAPVLITEEMVRSMRSGSVIVDLAAEAGGNCALTQAGETITVNGVTIIGPTNLPATVPLHASQMFSRNVETLIKHLAREGNVAIDPADEIVGPMIVARPD